MDIILKYLNKNITEKGIIKIILKYTSNKSADIFVESEIKVERKINIFRHNMPKTRSLSTTIRKKNKKYETEYYLYERDDIFSSILQVHKYLTYKNSKLKKCYPICMLYSKLTLDIHIRAKYNMNMSYYHSNNKIKSKAQMKEIIELYPNKFCKDHSDF